MTKQNYNIIKSDNVPIKMWTKNVPVASNAIDQLRNIANLPFIYRHVAAMPDVHLGKGATVGSVIATKGAIIPAAVGVDIGCGMSAVRLSLNANDLPDTLSGIRSAIEAAVPVGFNEHKERYGEYTTTTNQFRKTYLDLKPGWDLLCERHPTLLKMMKNPAAKLPAQLGTLGGGNHFIELCLDENKDVWVMLHSGSRGIGNAIGRYFIQEAKKDMERFFINLPDKDLSYFPEGSKNYDDYLVAMEWAQNYAAMNRNVMMELILDVLRENLPQFGITERAIDCHHNYVETENHYGENVLVTRKGAVRARTGDLGIIPGSMGAKSFIVRGKGNAESFHSCSHGAGRVMSRTEAKRVVSMKDHVSSTDGVECRKDKGVLDETPSAYKNIDDVMSSQEDLVEIVHTLKQVVCVKG